MSRYMLHLRIDELLDMQPDIKGRHARASYRKRVKRMVRNAIGDDVPPTPLKRAAIRCTRHSSTAPDYDGMVNGFKTVIDALLPDDRIGWAGVIVNDRMENLVGFSHPNQEYRWVQSPPGQGFLTVELVEVERT